MSSGKMKHQNRSQSLPGWHRDLSLDHCCSLYMWMTSLDILIILYFLLEKCYCYISVITYITLDLLFVCNEGIGKPAMPMWSFSHNTVDIYADHSPLQAHSKDISPPRWAPMWALMIEEGWKKKHAYVGFAYIPAKLLYGLHKTKIKKQELVQNFTARVAIKHINLTDWACLL